jgi:hypothetical protein
MSRQSHPLFAYFVVLFPWRIVRRLDALQDAGFPGPLPNLWQIGLGVLRMIHRLLFRTETVGTCSAANIRQGWRARLLKNRGFRVPLLLWERAIFPLDLSGLASSQENTIVHLLAAHHDGNQFAYDLEMLMYQPGALENLIERVDAIVSGADSRALWLRDLVVFEGYHEHLQSAARDALAGELNLSPEEASDPDISFSAYLSWCAEQPATPLATLRAIRRREFVIYTGTARHSPDEVS